MVDILLDSEPDGVQILDALALIADWRANRPGKAAPDEGEAPPAVKQALLTGRRVLARLKEGDTDPWTGRVIHTIVRKSNRFIVFLDERLELQWWWLQPPADLGLLARVQAEVARLEHESGFLRGGGRSWHAGWSLPWRRAKDQGADDADDALRSVRMLIGEAIAIVLIPGAAQNDCEATLKRAAETLQQSKEQYCRPTFFYTFAIAVAVIGAALWWVLRPTQGEQIIGGGFTLALAMQAAFCGALGAFVSALLRMRALNLEPFAGRWGIQVDAIARALIGAVAGVLTVLAYEAGLVLKAAVDAKAGSASEIAFALKMFIALVAGLSERILPSLVARGESMIGGAPAATKAESPPARSPP